MKAITLILLSTPILAQAQIIKWEWLDSTAIQIQSPTSGQTPASLKEF
jgi:hypothetical protein